MMPKDIISCVLDVNRIVPDSWNDWWNYWDSNKKEIRKVKGNHNKGKANWLGLDLYRTDLYNPEGDAFDFPFVKAEDLFPKMISAIKELPVDISVIRAVQSTSAVSAHRDCDFETLSLRVLLYDDNPRLNFYYFTENKRMVFQNLPETSNTWIYHDSRCLHGTTFFKDYFKIILMIYGEPKEEVQEFIKKGIHKYPDYVIKP